MKQKLVNKYKKMLGLSEWEARTLGDFIYEDEDLRRISLLRVAYTRTGKSRWFKKVSAKKAEISDLLPPLIAEDCKKEGYTFIFVQ